MSFYVLLLLANLVYSQTSFKYRTLEILASSSGIDVLKQKLCLQSSHFQAHRTASCRTYEGRDSLPKPTAFSNMTFSLSVYNERTGAVTFEKIFPTYLYYGWWCDLIWHLKRITPGRIVSVKVTSYGSFGLKNATAVLSLLGSVFVNHQDHLTQWIFIFVKGGKTFYEGLALNNKKLNGCLQLVFKNSFKTHNKIQEKEKFCKKYDAMGNFCSDPNIMLFWRKKRKLIWPVFQNIPVIVTAGKRYNYLYHSLYTIFSSPGVVKNMVHVVLGDSNNATLDLLNILNLKYHYILHSKGENSRMFQFYRKVYQFAADNFPSSQYVIILEEDVEVSTDFFSYMSQTLNLLKEDPTLYCVNAQAANMNVKHSIAPSRIMRGSMQVCWGYAVTMEFVHEALEAWKNPKESIIIYDYWIYTEVRGLRECIYPEVSRTKHYGLGVNTILDIYENFFYPIQLQPEPYVILSNVDKMKREMWQEQVRINLTKADLITDNPCRKSFYQNLKNRKGHFVYLYLAEELSDISTDEYFIIASCLKYWPYSTQSTHEGVFFLHPFHDVYLYLMAYPISRFSYILKEKTHPSIKDLNYAFEGIQNVSKDERTLPLVYHPANEKDVLLKTFHSDPGESR